MENLLQVLKLDTTVLLQFIIFLVAYIVLTRLVFKPYMQAFNQRHEATIGSREAADQMILETQDVQYKYETRARQINSEIKGIYESARREASKLQEELVHKAREEAEHLMKSSRDEIRKSLTAAREEVKKQIPDLSKAVSDRLLGKEVH